MYNPKSKRYEIYKKSDLEKLRAIMRGDTIINNNNEEDEGEDEEAPEDNNEEAKT